MTDNKNFRWRDKAESPEDRKYEFQTPTPVAEYMTSLLPTSVVSVLEPTPGVGQLVNVLKSRGYDVTAPEDYWLLNKEVRYDAVVANLPFSRKTFLKCPAEYESKGMVVTYEQIAVLMTMTDNLILLVPWFTIIDSDKRTRNLHSFGLISVTALPRKTFQYSRIQTCILQLQRGYTGKTEFILYDAL